MTRRQTDDQTDRKATYNKDTNFCSGQKWELIVRGFFWQPDNWTTQKSDMNKVFFLDLDLLILLTHSQVFFQGSVCLLSSSFFSLGSLLPPPFFHHYWFSLLFSIVSFTLLPIFPHSILSFQVSDVFIFYFSVLLQSFPLFWTLLDVSPI